MFLYVTHTIKVAHPSVVKVDNKRTMQINDSKKNEVFIFDSYEEYRNYYLMYLDSIEDEIIDLAIYTRGSKGHIVTLKGLCEHIIFKKKNNEICKESCNMPYTEDYLEKIEDKKNEFNDKLSKYKLLEQQILINTKDMQNEKSKKLFNEVIEIEKKHVRIVSYNIYDAIELSHEDKFIVYSISLEQYSNLVSLINENK